MTWTAHDLPKPKIELFASDSNQVRFGSVVASAPIQWSDVSKWYAGLSSDRYALSPAVQAKVAEVVKGAHTLDDSIRAVHKWIAQDLRYVSLSLGIGGYQPRTPDATLTTQYGDCKDKATLFVAVMRRMGVEAYPVLLNSSGGVAREHPTTHQFDHMIAAVKRSGSYTYVDLTSELTPYGEIPFSYQGSLGVIVHPDGVAEAITFPRTAVEGNSQRIEIRGTLAADGTFNGRIHELDSGLSHYGLRAAFSQPLAAEQTAALLRGLGASVFENGTADSLVVTGGRDLETPASFSVAIHGANALVPAGNAQMLTIPLAHYGSPAIIGQLKAETGRTSWFDASSISGYRVVVNEMYVTLPEGWKATLPSNVVADGVFGSYHAEYAQNGRELHLARTLTGHAGIQPPGKELELIAWLEAVSKDNAKFIVLQH